MIGKSKIRKKIFYVPGMISLIFIPLFCFYHFYKVDAFKSERSIDIFIPSDSVTIRSFLSFKRDYKVYNFNASESLDKKKLSNLQFALRSLKRTNDTINGIKIHLGEKMQYEVYIRLLDIFFIEKIPAYLQYNNDFVVLMVPKTKPEEEVIEIKPLGCAYEEVNKAYFLEKERREQFEHNVALYKKHWILFLGFFGIVFLNIFTLVKFNKNK